MKTFSPEITDEILVEQSLSGDRDAFAQIVKRYQVLLCSLAYSASGNVAQSEDIAQETFVIAWTQLAQLREPAKLKAWLCGIARHGLSSSRRREKNHLIEPLDSTHETASEEPLPNEMATRADDEDLAWRALERVPEIYREALVLYYREHQSIEHVAVLLDLNEETVRQRLSRGRKALQEQVFALLSSSLTRTAPALAFTSSVLSALPLASSGIAGAGVGGSVAKGGLMKSLSLAGLGASGLSVFAALLGVSVGNRVAIEMTESPRERAYMKQVARRNWGLILTYILGMALLVLIVPRVWNPSTSVLVVGGMLFAVAFPGTMGIFFLKVRRRQKSIRQEESFSHPDRPTRRSFQYTSTIRFLGLPLVAIDFDPVERRRVRAWFAFGCIAQGGILAVGQVAIAPIALGSFAIGIVSFGCVAIGGLTFAALSLGYWALGGFAAGYDALGGIALGIHTVAGGIAWGRDFAEGVRAIAQSVNDSAAFAAVAAHPVFKYYRFMPIAGAAMAIIALFPGATFLLRMSKQKRLS